ncbi:TonB-dependent receptor, partial [Enterococcus faecium]|uniref:TonB-dependent receptor domain-containing protein n=1 Tax=Enterococcus faecium TaxID=1352 RepID=UPI0010C21425
FVRDEHAVYAQDEWAVSDEFTLTYGARYEMLASSDKPLENVAFTKRYGYSNTENLDGAGIFLPRLGFKYDATIDLTLRGGIG